LYEETGGRDREILAKGIRRVKRGFMNRQMRAKESSKRWEMSSVVTGG
jgi:hypothetical protein